MGTAELVPAGRTFLSAARTRFLTLFLVTQQRNVL